MILCEICREERKVKHISYYRHRCTKYLSCGHWREYPIRIQDWYHIAREYIKIFEYLLTKVGKGEVISSENFVEMIRRITWDNDIIEWVDNECKKQGES